MMPMPGRTGRPRLTWRPSTVLHKGQAALVMGLVTSGFVVSGIFLSRDLALQTADAPARTRPRITAPAAPPARILAEPAAARNDLRRTTGRRIDGVAPVGTAIRQRPDDARNRLGGSVVPPVPTPRRVPRRTA